MKNKNILISGCSFSASQKNKKRFGWIPYSDLLSNDFNVINLSKESRGNGYIVDSIVNYIENIDKPDYIIVQLSAFTRLIDNMEDRYNSGFVGGLYEHLYNKDYLDIESWNKFDNQIYLHNFVKIKMLIEYLKNTKIPHMIFFGWNQVSNNSEWETKFENIIKDNTNFWRFNKLGGLLEFGIDAYGDNAKVNKEDFHPTSEVHLDFYKKIIKPRIDENR